MVHSDLDGVDSTLYIPSGGDNRKMEWAQAMTHLFNTGEISWEDFKIFVLSMGCVDDPKSFKRDGFGSKSIEEQKTRNKARSEREARIPSYLRKEKLKKDGIEHVRPTDERPTTSRKVRKKAAASTSRVTLDACTTHVVGDVCERCA